MLQPELLRQIKHLEVRAGRLATDLLAGEYVSAFKGQGMEFDEVRPYVPGDDVRRIDWNVTARMDQPFIKVFREERELTLMLIVDVSRSQFFGRSRSKQEVAAELAAVLAFLAIRNQDRVGLLLFSDQVESFIPPKKGRGHVWNIIRNVLTFEPKGTGTNIPAALQHAAQLQKRRSTCFLISDFLATNFADGLSRFARRHDLVCVRVQDLLERHLPSAGVVRFVDAESGLVRTVPTFSSAFRAAMEAQELQRQDAWRNLCRAKGIDTFDLNSSESVVPPLERYLRRRERRRAR